MKVGNDELNLFLNDWDIKYKNQAENISLFKRNVIEKWDEWQRQNFIKIFYHSRGHFKDFLWHLGNFAPNKISKAIVLENIAEEFNAQNPSHEQLYLDFALKEGVDLSKEYIVKQYFTSSMENFNHLHIEWLYSHSNWDSKLAAFSAYERLDSTDYELLSNALFENIEHEHLFFLTHRKAEHFNRTYTSLLEAWKKNKHLVTEAFEFIANTQLDMWRSLYNETIHAIK